MLSTWTVPVLQMQVPVALTS
jgi:hypothetical protein